MNLPDSVKLLVPVVHGQAPVNFVTQQVSLMSLRVAFLLFAFATTLVITGCQGMSRENPDPAHNARNALDWAGIYRGVLPCADCEGIETVVVLNSDGHYQLHEKYRGEDKTVFSREGAFTWGEAGTVITLEGDQAVQLFVGENHLVRLASDGSRITGALAGHYTLAKTTDSLVEKYWKLVELNGRPVPSLKREPYMILKADENRVNGFGGCNGFGGVYELDEATSRISFKQIMSTLMACAEGMEVEQRFHEALKSADSYSFDGNHLTLNRARMAPLARFKVVYLY